MNARAITPGQPRGISQRFASSSLTTLAVALSLAMVLLIVFEYVALRSALMEDSRAEAAVLADNLSASLIFHDAQAATEIVSGAQHSPAVLAVGVYDPARRLLATYSRDGTGAVPAIPSDLAAGDVRVGIDRLEMVAPIRYKNVEAGLLFVSKSLQPVYARLGLYLLATLVIVAATLTLAAVVINRARHEINQAEQRLQTMALVDAVTGLENRHAFHERLTSAVDLAQRFGEKVAIVAIDLDNFKSVNDTLGHQAGDDVLRMVAQRLRVALRRDDTICRLGGDEFSIILPRIADERELAIVGDKVTAAGAAPYHIGGYDFFITTSVGIAVFPSHAEDVEGLIGCADRAMYRAKEQGKNHWVQFSAEMNEGLARRVALENALWKAAELNQISLHYQPQFAADGRTLVGAEALMRWTHPDYGMVSPADFIPIAERNGQIVSLGDLAIRTVAADAERWWNASGTPVRLSVNVSARQMVERGFVDSVARVVRQHGIAKGRLEIEITESVLMDNIERQMEIMQQLRSLGVAIAIDDFGTGYSSMAYLRNLPVDRLKIDRAFVRELPHPRDLAIVRAMVALAHNLGLEVVAEGVETEVQRQHLADAGVDVLQGYLLGKPMPLARCRETLGIR